MWRDPLDELIEDLEHTLPASQTRQDEDLPRLFDIQRAAAAILVHRVDGPDPSNEPWYRAVMEQFRLSVGKPKTARD